MRPITFIFCLLLIVSSCKKDKTTKDYVVSTSCTSNNSTHTKVVLLVLGQSNAANAGGELFYLDCNKALNFFDGSYYPMKDPLHGANGEGGSVWSRLAAKLIENNFADSVIVVPAAIGGTYIEQWIPGGELNYLITEAVERAHDNGLQFTHVLWHQGESNNSALHTDISPQQNALNYVNNFHILVSYLRSIQLNCPIFLAQTSRCATLQIDSFLLAAQASLESDSLGIYLGPNTDLLGNEYRYDDCHFNGIGLDLHAQMWADSLISF